MDNPADLLYNRSRGRTRLPESGAEALDSQVNKIPDSTCWRTHKDEFHGNQFSARL
jgi:hypothetical protein